MANLDDSDSDSDINVYKSTSSNTIIISDEESLFSISDGESDSCPICFTRLRQQDLASPDTCFHTFCLNCLTAWTKNAQTCPIDRLTFKWIILRSSDGEVLRQIDISIKSEEQPLLNDDVEDLTYCEVCHLSNREDEMLLCDMCDCGYHMDCLNPPLYVIPLEDWYCPQCHNNARDEHVDDEISVQEVAELLNDLRDSEQLPRPRQSRQQRLVPRTRAFERVRKNTQRIQLNMAEGSMSSTHTISIGKKAKKYSKRKVRVDERKEEKKFARKKNSQLAEKLGLCSSKRSKNTFSNNISLGTSSNYVDHRSLSLFGHNHELNAPVEPLHMSTRAQSCISTADTINALEPSPDTPALLMGSSLEEEDVDRNFVRHEKDKFGRDLSKTSHSDFGSGDRSRPRKRKRSRSKQRRRSISSPRLRSRKLSGSCHRSESRNRHRSRNRLRSWSRHESRCLQNSSRCEKNQVLSTDRYRSPKYDERKISPLPKRRAQKSKEKIVYSKIEKDYERKLLKNDKSAKKKFDKKSKDYQYLSLSPRSSLGVPAWLSPRNYTTSWSPTDISRSPSPVCSCHGPDIDTNYLNRDREFSDYNENITLNNLSVIVKNNIFKKSKLSKRHTSRQITVPSVEEVFDSGDNILESVNFNKDKTVEKTSQEPVKRKRQEAVPNVSSKKAKNTNTTAVPDITLTNQKSSIKTQRSKWKIRQTISRTIYEDKQVTKSETKKNKSPGKSKENVFVKQKPSEKIENNTQTVSTIMVRGPKTPLEPVNANSKADIISNNSCEFNSQDEDHTQFHDVRGRGPNTPPEPPRSVYHVSNETAYDLFEHTKSNFSSLLLESIYLKKMRKTIMINDNNHNDTFVQPIEEKNTTDSQAPVLPQIVAKTITTPFLESQSLTHTTTDISPEKLTNNITNTLNYTSPVAAETPIPVQPTHLVTNTDEIIDLDDNNNSPPVVPQPNSVLSNFQAQNKNEVRNELDFLLNILPRVKKSSDIDKNIEKYNYFKSSKSSKSKDSKLNNFNVDSIYNSYRSAVELDLTNEFLEKLSRQERVVEEVEHVLKPHYNKKHITKEQYKDIMRKSVPKICHSKSGEINPEKIYSFIEAYVIKYRHSHRKYTQHIATK